VRSKGRENGRSIVRAAVPTSSPDARPPGSQQCTQDRDARLGDCLEKRIYIPWALDETVLR